MKFKYFLVLTGVIFGVSFKSLAIEVQTSGDVSMNAVESQKPSSVQDQTSFQMPEARVGARVRAVEDLDFNSELDFGRYRDSVSNRWNLQVQRAYFDFQKVFNGSFGAQFGLVPQLWSDLEDRFWEHRDLGLRGAAFSQRYGYMARSDLGMAFGSTLGDWGLWSFSVVNGEGSNADEQGPHKDFQIYIETHPADRWTLALSAIEGAYENTDSSVAQKERVLALLGFEQPLGFQGSLQWGVMKDPVDKVNGIYADRVDLTAQGGQSTKAQGGSLILKNRWAAAREGAFYELFGRWDLWNAAVGVPQKNLQQRMLGFSYVPRQLLQFSLAWSQVAYDDGFATSVREASDFLFSARLKW